MTMRAFYLTAALVAIAALAGCDDGPRHDAAWYRAHPQERAAKLKECADGTREKRLTSNCESAKTAEGEAIFGKSANRYPSIGGH